MIGQDQYIHDEKNPRSKCEVLTAFSVQSLLYLYIPKVLTVTRILRPPTSSELSDSSVATRRWVSVSTAQRATDKALRVLGSK